MRACICVRVCAFACVCVHLSTCVSQIFVEVQAACACLSLLRMGLRSAIFKKKGREGKERGKRGTHCTGGGKVRKLE